MSHLSLVAALSLAACSGGATSTPAPSPVAPAPVVVDTSPAPALLLSQAWFDVGSATPTPQPAKLVILRHHGDQWDPEVILDPESNVFHKAIAWRGGILTIGAEGAKLKHWTRTGDGPWTATTLWERSWGGQFDRLRDLEVGDVDGDGEEEIVLATHDRGVVAVGDEVDGAWTFTELDQKDDTFVHEIEIGDVDGDGVTEFYATPSERNRASLTSQPGEVVRYDWDASAGTYVRSLVMSWTESHAKEILVADLGHGPQLFAVREGHSVKRGGRTELVDPVRIVRLDRAADGTWSDTLVATIEDHQTRFLVPGDVDGDGTVELVAAGFKSGLWLLEPRDDGTFAVTSVDRASSGFEHATHVTDLDGDGAVEIYVAADDQGKVRRYTWNGDAFDREEIADIGARHFTWNIQDARL